MEHIKGEEQYGVGLEMEGFILNGERPQERVEGVPASEWVMESVRRTMPALVKHLSFEQASVMLELKTDVFPDQDDAVKQLLEIRALVNAHLARVSCHLSFQPVLSEDFEFVPATRDPNSRTHQLIHDWGQTSEGVQRLYATAIASLQINDSRPFRNVVNPAEKLERARNIHNLYTAKYTELNEDNLSMRNARGRTRMEDLLFLLPAVKQNAFRKMGYEDPLKAVLPDHFYNVEEMTRWMCAHSDVTRLEDARCKNEHAVTVKVKRDQRVWIAESRVYDAVDNLQAITNTVRRNSKLLIPYTEDL